MSLPPLTPAAGGANRPLQVGFGATVKLVHRLAEDFDVRAQASAAAAAVAAAAASSVSTTCPLAPQAPRACWTW